MITLDTAVRHKPTGLEGVVTGHYQRSGAAAEYLVAVKIAKANGRKAPVQIVATENDLVDVSNSKPAAKRVRPVKNDASDAAGLSPA